MTVLEIILWTIITVITMALSCTIVPVVMQRLVRKFTRR